MHKLPRKESETVEFKTSFSDEVNKTTDVTDTGKERSLTILSFLSKNPHLSATALAKNLNVTKRTVLRDLDSLKKSKKIHRIGSEKNGYWEVQS